ncbi:hypothetical protein E1176_11065 [Fulvivirga sp. RKSG066]|uniref:hypothetical protein n=1 Tax=Fulvivirga aurantia TaxID=2529383 RepID=UPI0012BB8AFF|nr:hypothetical protein [Fulvivirga aurantia]MTI21559.1 hypothetical protein [Fulvivirga aurantia]
MKKIILMCLLASPVITWAQDTEGTVEVESQYKPTGGDKTLELQFEPFGDNPININGIRARWFSSQRSAFRLNIFVGVDADSEITQQSDPDLDLKELKDKDMTVSINIRPGMEKHLKGTEKLSPYFGWEADLAYQTSSNRTEFQNNDNVEYSKVINTNGFARVGLNAIAGMDFYVSPKLYLGAELGFGASYTRLLSVKLKSNVDGFQKPDPVKRGGSIDIGPNVNAQIRLGYAF